MPRGHSAVVVTLYRALARAARRFDHDPALKALVSLSPDKYYDHDTQSWNSAEREQLRGYTALAMDFVGRPLYRPVGGRPESLCAYIRRKFREDAQEAARSEASADDIGGRLDAGFAALCELNQVISLSLPLPRTRYRRPSAPFSGSARADPRGETLLPVGSLPDRIGGASGSPPLLLAAHPMQLSSSFGRGVVLLTAHSERGSDGLVINKPSCIRLRHASRLLGARIPSADIGPLGRNRIYIGGPVAGPLMAVHPHTCLLGPAEDGAVEWEEEEEEGEGAEETRGDAGKAEITLEVGKGGAEITLRVRGEGAPGELPAGLLAPAGAAAAEASGAGYRGEDKLEDGGGEDGGEDGGEEMEGEVHLESPSGGPLLVRDEEAPLCCSRVTWAWLRRANALLAKGEASAQDFKLVIGHTVWGANQLQGEIEHGEWMAAAPPAPQLAKLTLAQPRKAFGRATGERGGAAVGRGSRDGAAAGCSDGESGRRPGKQTHGKSGRRSLAEVIGRGEEHILKLMREEGGRVHLNRSQRQVFLHMVLDEEIVPLAGQQEWARVVRALGGEYRSIATLAHAQEEQCAQLLEHEEEEDPLEEELTYEEE
jgi:putative AlgH/UPF0301 family transcriptional regulator